MSNFQFNIWLLNTKRIHALEQCAVYIWLYILRSKCIHCFGIVVSYKIQWMQYTFIQLICVVFLCFVGWPVASLSADLYHVIILNVFRHQSHIINLCYLYHINITDVLLDAEISINMRSMILSHYCQFSVYICISLSVSFLDIFCSISQKNNNNNNIHKSYDYSHWPTKSKVIPQNNTQLLTLQHAKWQLKVFHYLDGATSWISNFHISITFNVVVFIVSLSPTFPFLEQKKRSYRQKKSERERERMRFEQTLEFK